MAVLDPNTLIGIIQGKLGNLVFVRRKDGRIIVRGRPVRKADFTPGELHSQSHLAQANAYIQRLKAQPEAYAVYQAAARLNGKRACDLAKADFSHPPLITDVDLSQYGGRVAESIRIQASDDFGVKSVELGLTKLDGTLIEHGTALIEPNSSYWRYVTQVVLTPGQIVAVHATALDRAGNVVSKTVHHALV